MSTDQPPPHPPPPGGDPYGGRPPYGYDPGGGYGEPDPRLRGMPPLGTSGRRLMARIIDALIVGIPVGIVLSVLGLVHWNGNENNAFAGDVSSSAFYAVVYFVYEALMLASSGQTVGKRWMRIRVAMLADGSVPTRSAAWTRAAVYSLPGIVPCLGFLFWLVNVLWHLFDHPFRQCLHDKAANTVVVSAS